MELKDKADVEQFFTNLSQKSHSGFYQGLDFEVVRTNLGSLIVGLIFGLFDKQFNRTKGQHRGHLVRIFFPKPLRIDFWFESRRIRIKSDDALTSSFYWSGISDNLIRKLISGNLLTDLLQLRDKTQHIIISSKWLQCEPIPQLPKDATELFENAVKILKQVFLVLDNSKIISNELDETDQTSFEGPQTDEELAPEEHGPFVTIYRGSDPSEAQMLEEILKKNGINPQLVGARNAGVFGLSSTLIKLHIDVPESQVELAKTLMESYIHDRDEKV